jgi:hypothetical protein
MHEASLHQDNAFLTLTYDDEHLPPGGSLDLRAFPLFMKRLRAEIVPQRVRYFYAGEYGDDVGRPHYHGLLFGYDFPDKRPAGRRGDHPVWRSDRLSALWPDGFHELGSVSFDSAAYVARYVVKKVRGEAAVDHYLAVDGATGEVFGREPEFCQMSRRPGIGAGWFERFGEELEPEGTVIQSGKEVPMPRYYRKLMKDGSPEAERLLARVGEWRRFANEPRMSREQLRKNEVFLESRTKILRRLG